jgi:hypothetical protein
MDSLNRRVPPVDYDNGKIRAQKFPAEKHSEDRLDESVA